MKNIFFILLTIGIVSCVKSIDQSKLGKIIDQPHLFPSSLGSRDVTQINVQNFTENLISDTKTIDREFVSFGYGHSIIWLFSQESDLEVEYSKIADEFSRESGMYNQGTKFARMIKLDEVGDEGIFNTTGPTFFDESQFETEILYNKNIPAQFASANILVFRKCNALVWISSSYSEGSEIIRYAQAVESQIDKHLCQD